MTTLRQREKVIQIKTAPRFEAGGEIIETRIEGDLRQILQPEVQAVIYKPVEFPRWMEELGGAVESGIFQIKRVILQQVTVNEIAAWLESNTPQTAIPPNVSDQFKSEILSMVSLEQALTGASQFIVRMFTEAPTHRCGFHVDTTLPRSPTVGLLRVFNGTGTLYVHPENITRMSDFYRHFEKREQLGKELEKAAKSQADKRYAEILREIEIVDKAPGFLYDSGDIRKVPVGAIVAFKHLDARLHWSDHPKGLTWVHCSPSDGPRRLVVNITAYEAQVSGSKR